VPLFNEKNNDTKDYSKQLEFLISEPYYARKKIVNQSSDFPVCRTGSYRHKKALLESFVDVDSSVVRCLALAMLRQHVAVDLGFTWPWSC